MPATLVVADDHLLRQLFWPESVFGIVAPEWWRFLEHAFYVVFEDCLPGRLVHGEHAGDASARPATGGARGRAVAGRGEVRRARPGDDALKQSQQNLVRNEKLAAVGKLAASVGHELRNPLAAIRKRTRLPGEEGRRWSGAAATPACEQFFGIIDRELDACSRIISDLLDFARERKPELATLPAARRWWTRRSRSSRRATT